MQIQQLGICMETSKLFIYIIVVCVRVRVCVRARACVCACVLNIQFVWNDSPPPNSFSSIGLPNQIKEWKQ